MANSAVLQTMDRLLLWSDCLECPSANSIMARKLNIDNLLGRWEVGGKMKDWKEIEPSEHYFPCSQIVAKKGNFSFHLTTIKSFHSQNMWTRGRKHDLIIIFYPSYSLPLFLPSALPTKIKRKELQSFPHLFLRPYNFLSVHFPYFLVLLKLPHILNQTSTISHMLSNSYSPQTSVRYLRLIGLNNVHSKKHKGTQP